MITLQCRVLIDCINAINPRCLEGCQFSIAQPCDGGHAVRQGDHSRGIEDIGCACDIAAADCLDLGQAQFSGGLDSNTSFQIAAYAKVSIGLEICSSIGHCGVGERATGGGTHCHQLGDAWSIFEVDRTGVIGDAMQSIQQISAAAAQCDGKVVLGDGDPAGGGIVDRLQLR